MGGCLTATAEQKGKSKNEEVYYNYNNKRYTKNEIIKFKEVINY